MLKINSNVIYILLFLFIILSCEESSKNTQSKIDKSKKKNLKNTSSKNEQNANKIVFFGNSITAGHGVGKSKAFPAIINKKIDSAGYNYKVINAGVSGETTSGGLRRVSWVLKQEKPDIFVLELGANDGLRGQPVSEMQANLQKIIDTVKTRYPETLIILAGMKLPPNLGKEYTKNFYKAFKELHQKNDISFIPFILKGVARKPDLNQEDGIHPTAKGHKIVAENVWKVLQKKLKKKR